MIHEMTLHRIILYAPHDGQEPTKNSKAGRTSKLIEKYKKLQAF